MWAKALFKFARAPQRNFLEQLQARRFCPFNIHPETHHVTVQQVNQFQFIGEPGEKCLFLIC